MTTIAPCPECSEARGERYDGGLCWICHNKAANGASGDFAPPNGALRPAREGERDSASEPGRARRVTSESSARADGADGTPAGVLAASRVDLLALIRDGIPPREFIPGTGGALVAGKRHHIAAGAKTGKSLAFGVIASVDVVAAGGVVVILDRENGADEYARRLASVLDARGADDRLRQLVTANYRYHAWPEMKLEWRTDPGYAAAFDGAAVVIFDSSRAFLTNVGLSEDGSDDFAEFTAGLIDPLYRAGIATLILDNTGHANPDRARGTKSKADLCDAMFSLKAPDKFGVDRAGRLELECTDSRIGELTGKWDLELGGGAYGSWAHRGGGEARKLFHDACVAALTERSPLSRDDLLKAARASGAGGKTETLRGWLAELVGDPSSPVAHDADAGYFLGVAPVAGQGGPGGGPGPLAPAPSFKGPGATPGPGGRPGANGDGSEQPALEWLDVDGFEVVEATRSRWHRGDSA